MSNALFLFDNLVRPPLAQRWVSASLAAADCRFTFLCSGTVAGLVLAHHNLTLGATVRLQGANVADFSATVHDSGWLNAFPAGTTDASRAGQRQHFWYRLGTPVAAAYWRLQVLDASNPAGYIAVGRLMMAAGAWQTSINMAMGASFGWENGQEVQASLTGAEWSVDREARKVARFDIDYLPTDEAMRNPFEMARLASTYRRELLFVWDPSDGEHSQRRTIWGRLRELGPLEAPYVSGMSAPGFEVGELLP